MVWHSTRYWRGKHAVAGDIATRYVLVDLLVDHPVYYLGNLILAKYLELTQGLRPWALVSSESDKVIVLLARSFGIEDFTFVRDTVAASVSPVAVRILKQFEGLEGSALRQRVLGLEVDGLPVGDLLYDTYLREERRLTIESVDEALRVYVALLVNYYKLYTDILDQNEVAATVVGHLVYARFGVLARQAARYGATVYARSGGRGMRIQKRRSVGEARDFISRVTPDLVDTELAHGTDAAVEAGSITLERRMAGTGNEFQFLNEEGYSDRRAMWSRNEFSKAMGLSPDRKVGLIMLHAFPDASHTVPDMIFDDYYDWHLQTLEVASEVPEIDWLIKPHPYVHNYTDDDAPRLAAEKYAAENPHIHLVSENLNTRSFPEITDFLVTANSKAGVEFAGVGVPVVVVGRAFYAGLGFTVEPNSRDAYSITLREAGTLSLSEEQRRRALVANDIFYRRMVCDCAFIPDTRYAFWLPFNEIEFWQGYQQALRDLTLENDPLFCAFNEFVESEDSTLLRAR